MTASLTRMARTQKYLDTNGWGSDLLNTAIEEVVAGFQKGGVQS